MTDADKEALMKGLEFLKVNKEPKKRKKTGKDSTADQLGTKDKKGKGISPDSKRGVDFDNLNMQNLTAEEISEGYRKLRDKIEEKHKELDRIQDDLDKRQERFMKRRAKLQEILGELEKDLNVRLGKETVKNENEGKMKGKQQEICDMIETIPQKIKKMIDVELEEYSKAFNTQVQNMKKEMNTFLTGKKTEENNAKKQEDLRAQLGLMYLATEKIDRENTKLMAECKQYEEDFKKQEQARLKLFQELVDQKKENANFLEQIAYYKLAITEVKEEDNVEEGNVSKVMQSSFMSSSSAKKFQTGAGMRSGYQSAYPLDKSWKGNQKDMLERYKNVIEKLKSTLETEKKKLKQSRLLYAKEMQAKTELEELLLQCVEEVKSEAVNRKSTDKPFSSSVKKKPAGEKTEFTKEQREKIVEMLLSQERVLALLYDKTFPTKQEGDSNEAEQELGGTEKKLLTGELDQPTP